MTKYITTYVPENDVDPSKHFLKYEFARENGTEVFGSDFISFTRLKNIKLSDPKITLSTPQQVRNSKFH